MAASHLTAVDADENLFLSGRYAPVLTETDALGLPAEGSVPTDLTGLFVRNGPNPRYPPLGSYTWPLEGDGMVHGVWFEDGQTRYRNRWVRTQGLAAEERAGRALFGGLRTPAFVDPELLGPDPDPGWPVKLDAFINVVRHHGRLLALGEGVPPYELTENLSTRHRYTFAGQLPAGMCAHPRIDPRTGEMIVFRYDVREPYLTWTVVGRAGQVVRPPAAIAGLERAHLVHDFAVTEHWVVLVLSPAIIDADALLTGGELLSWRPELGTRIALVPRSGAGPTRWLSTETFWAWHFAGAYETEVKAGAGAEGGAEGEAGLEGGAERKGGAHPDVVLDFPRWSMPSFAAAGTVAEVRGAFTRAVLSPAAGTVDLTVVDDQACEFPRIDDRRTARSYRYATVLARSDERRLVAGEHDRLVRHDLVTGESVSYDTGTSLGEVVFAPRDGATEELDGYYLAFASSLGDDEVSWLLVWDAADFPAPPRARLRCPHRVPNGLHATFLPAG